MTAAERQAPDRNLAMELVRVTEAAALAASRWMGRGDKEGADAFRQVGAPAPKYFRPPKGFTDEAIGVLADANQYRTIFWDLCLERFVDHTPDMADAVQDMLTRVKPGSIILAHDGGIPTRTKTLQTLPMLLEGLRARGFKMVDVTQLLKAAQHVNR